VEDDIPEAMYYLGGCYFHGNVGLAKSTKKAAKIWKRASELGNVEAMALLGSLYVKGDGVKLDRKKAIQLLRTSADGGYANAQYHLSKELNNTFLAYAEAEAAKFYRGEGRDIDENALTARLSVDHQSPRFNSREVYRYARLSAEQGFVPAMLSVGHCYTKGVGVERDLDEARRWLERGAAAGDAHAVAALEKLDA
jgi:TPR repeat protein